MNDPNTSLLMPPLSRPTTSSPAPSTIRKTTPCPTTRPSTLKPQYKGRSIRSCCPICPLVQSHLHPHYLPPRRLQPHQHSLSPSRQIRHPQVLQQPRLARPRQRWQPNPKRRAPSLLVLGRDARGHVHMLARWHVQPRRGQDSHHTVVAGVRGVYRSGEGHQKPGLQVCKVGFGGDEREGWSEALQLED